MAVARAGEGESVAIGGLNRKQAAAGGHAAALIELATPVLLINHSGTVKFSNRAADARLIKSRGCPTRTMMEPHDE